MIRKLSAIPLLFFIVTRLAAQGGDRIDFHLQNLPAQGLAMDKGWRFQPGDNSAWASSYFNDSLWPTADLSNYKIFLPQLRLNGIGWFRMRILVDSQFSSSELAIVISQLGASEIYVNGNLLLTLGRVGMGKNLISDNPHGKPFILHVNPGDTLCLALRFASHVPSNLWLLTNTGIQPIQFKLSSFSQAINEFERDLQSQRIPFGFSFMCIGIGIVFMLLHFFFPEERINLLFGGFCLFVSMIPVIQFQLAENNLDMSAYGLFYFLVSFIERITSILILAIVTLIVFNKIFFHQWIIMLYVVVLNSFFQFFFAPGPVTYVLNLLAYTVMAVELIRLAVYAFMQSKFLVGIAAAISGLLHFTFTIRAITSVDLTAYYYQLNLATCLTLLGIYLAGKFASHSKLLLYQLEQMNRISREHAKRESQKQS